jgi:hypothetical protein
MRFSIARDNGNADALSRLPVQEEQSESDKSEEKVSVLKKINESKEIMLDMLKIRVATGEDAMLVALRKYFQTGKLNVTEKILFAHYYGKEELLSVDCGCVLLGERIIIPRSLIRSALELLHSNQVSFVE